MKKMRSTAAIMAFLGLTAMSCKEVQKEDRQDNSIHSEMDNSEQINAKANFNDMKTSAMFQHYIHIKTAQIGRAHV